MQQTAPDLDAIGRTRRLLGTDIVHTPLVRCVGVEEQLGNGTEVYGKLEFLQRTGTFKARGALATVRALSSAQRAAGVTAVSAGNHAVATAFAARAAGTHARVVMTARSNSRPTYTPHLPERRQFAIPRAAISCIRTRAKR